MTTEPHSLPAPGSKSLAVVSARARRWLADLPHAALQALHEPAPQRGGTLAAPHVAVILDGNRRWASLAGLREASAGHRAGADKLDQLLDWCVTLGIEQVTVWALSNENLARPARELAALLEVVADKLEALAALHGAQSMRIRVYGRLDELPACAAPSAQ
jgi:undecaprenyl pyrophosphate synthase